MQVKMKCCRWISLVLLGLLLQACGSTYNDVVVVNGATEKINSIQLDTSGESLVARNIDRGATWRGRIRINYDSPIKVIVEFESGKRLQKQGGGVVPLIDAIHELKVRDNDIEFGGSVR
jgi:hypothetical protein